MKKTMKLKMYFVMLAFGLMSVALQSCNDDDDSVSVPVELENAFVNEFGNIGHSWATRGSYFVADFRDNNMDMEAWFNGNGEWVMTEADIRYEALPTAVQNAFESGPYAKWKREDVDRLERKGMETVYVIEVELGHQEMDLYYNAEGVLLKEVADAEDDSENYLPAPLSAAIKTFLSDKFNGYKLLEVEKEKNGTLEVDILFNNERLEVIFDKADSWIATVKEVRMSLVPELVKKAAQDAYPGAVIDDDEADWVETPAGNYFVIELEKGDQDIYVKVTEAGKVLE